MTQQSVSVKLDDKRSIEFECQEDVFIYYALTGNYVHLADAYERVMGERLTTKQFRFYQTKGQRFRYILSSTRVSDGTPLLEIIRGKITL